MQNEEKTKRKYRGKSIGETLTNDVERKEALARGIKMLNDANKKINAKSLKDVKMEEDKDWTNCHEIDGENNRLTFLPHGIVTGLKTHYRGSRGKDRASLKSTVLLILALTFLVVLTGYLIYQIGGFKIAYAFDHDVRIYKQMCGDIPLQEQGENCSILLAKVLKK